MHGLSSVAVCNLRSKNVTAAMPQQELPMASDLQQAFTIFAVGVMMLLQILVLPSKYIVTVQVKYQVDLPNSVVLITSVLLFGGGFFGISYGILSASWDPMREGSRLGLTEFKANLPLVLERVRDRRGKGRV